MSTTTISIYKSILSDVATPLVLMSDPIVLPTVPRQDADAQNITWASARGVRPSVRPSVCLSVCSASARGICLSFSLGLCQGRLSVCLLGDRLYVCWGTCQDRLSVCLLGDQSGAQPSVRQHLGRQAPPPHRALRLGRSQESGVMAGRCIGDNMVLEAT